MKNFGEFFNNQIEHAGTIILSRTQNVSEAKLKTDIELIRSLNKDAHIITTPWDDIDGKQILDAMENVTNLELEMLAEAAAKVAEEHEHHHHHDGECGCGHDHHDEEHEHHHHDGECGCGHDHHDEEHEHHHHHDDECGCGHDHHDEEHEHHHHDGECGCGHHHEHGHHHADEVFTSWGVETPNKYDKEELSEILRKLSETDDYGNILRAKGMLPCTDGKWMFFDLVPEEYEIREGKPDFTGRICVIGADWGHKPPALYIVRIDGGHIMAQEEYQIPIFLINGQLDSGKTRFISDTIAMGQFAEAKNKLLIVCEEGEEEYSEKLLKDNGVDMVVLEKEELTEAKLNELDKEYDPWIVIVEYNGMWDPALLMGTAKPRGWEIYQSITLIDATAFNLQWNNMRSIIAETVKYTDMVIFNRCKSGMDLGSYRRSMRALNNTLQIVFEDDKGEMMSIAEQLPYDVNADIIEVDDADYGIWYMDVSERPDVYVGKKVRFKGQVLKNKYFKDKNFVPGRKVMTCCAEDTQFIGYISFYNNIASLENRQWIMVTATIKNEFQMAYKKKGPVLYVEKVENAEPPVEEMVYF